MVLVMVPRAQVSAQRINEVLNTDFSIKDPENPKLFPETNEKKGNKKEDNNVKVDKVKAPIKRCSSTLLPST